MTDISIIIVSFNVRRLLAECLDSIREALDGTMEPTSDASTRMVDSEVIVVDSGSTDNTLDMLRNEYPWVKVIPAKTNIGFGNANNLGMRAGSGEFFFLLNPDTRIIGDSVQKMVQFMYKNPDVGLVGPKLLNEDGTTQSSRRRFPTLLTAFFESTWLQPIAPKSVLSDYYVEDRSDVEVSQVDWVTGAALFTRQACMEEIGGFDKDFFMYSEELDLQRRMRQAGWQIVFFPEAQIVHYGGKSSEQVLSARHIEFQVSKIRYFRKYSGLLPAFSLRLFLLASYAQQLAIECTKYGLGHRRDLRRARIALYWTVLKSGLKGA